MYRFDSDPGHKPLNLLEVFFFGVARPPSLLLNINFNTVHEPSPSSVHITQPDYIRNMSTIRQWYELVNPQQIDSPALLVFPERVRHNIRTAIRMAGGVQRLRPHVKTSKSPGAIARLQEAGITQFKCATIAEAEMLAMSNAKDVLLAYQPTGPKLERFISLIKSYPGSTFSCLTDNLAVANEQAGNFAAAGIRVAVYVDLNVGMNRSGIVPGPAVIELIQFLSQQDSVNSIGLHVYDGHIRNPNFDEKEREVNESYKAVEALIKEIESLGLPSPQIVIGGSPSFSVHCNRPGVVCSPGTFIYWDHGYSTICPEQDFLPAAVLMTRVISLPAEGMITVDLGHKSVASENEISRRIYFPNDGSLKPLSQSEEHLVLRNDGNKSYKVGDVLYGIPYHICPTVALYESVHTFESGIKTGEWRNTARDRRIVV